MKSYNSHFNVDIKLLSKPKNRLIDKILKSNKVVYFDDFDYDVFCWLFTDNRIIHNSDLLFYNNPINESEIVYLSDDDEIVLEDGTISYADAYFDFENTDNQYNKIIFSLNLHNAELLKINFQYGVVNFNLVTNKKTTYNKKITIENKATFFDFLELKKIKNSWVISDNIKSLYNSLHEAMKNRLIEN